jgi:cytochrome d ubiquinol oxidase subunit I
MRGAGTSAILGRAARQTADLEDDIVNLVVLLAAVNPVPWARSQMAFTLACHIILVPLGVSWAAMTLIANHRGLKHDEPDALRLAQRWSKYMAVTFAVGAVTGTVLTFEFGLLWPKFMGQWGEAFGVPFAFEGLFFFTEAIFVTIYIFGWRRLKPWAHFWTGVPIVVAGVFGSISVVSANAWMNSPEGFTLDSHGNVTDVSPVGVIFNKGMPLEAAHMVVAAYLVGGFLVASVYAMGMLRGRTDRYHRLGFLIAFTVAAIATPVQMGVGDSLARWVYNNQPTKFAAMELVTDTSTDVPEIILGHLNDDGTVSGGFEIPGMASYLSDPSTGTATEVQGLNAVHADDRPTTRQVNVVHLSWDIMLGLGTLLFLLSLWYWAAWIFKRDMPRSRWFLRIAASAGVLAVITMEAGWVVTEVGRQPWIVYEQMRVEDAATGNTGVWITFILVVVLYVALATTTIVVLRRMSRRYRGEEELEDDHDAPYGPAEPPDIEHLEPVGADR